jgi:hypothetical protein
VEGPGFHCQHGETKTKQQKTQKNRRKQKNLPGLPIFFFLQSNLSYSGGRDKENHSLRATQAKISETPLQP